MILSNIHFKSNIKYLIHYVHFLVKHKKYIYLLINVYACFIINLKINV